MRMARLATASYVQQRSQTRTRSRRLPASPTKLVAHSLYRLARPDDERFSFDRSMSERRKELQDGSPSVIVCFVKKPPELIYFALGEVAETIQEGIVLLGTE